jgi:flavin reductase (DIM6/NTAB) family NADH-FMN oxidoreductase RutF
MKLRDDMLTHGVNIVTAYHEGRRAGLAVAWATQVGTERVLLCIGSHSATRQLILESKAFGLSVLRADQLEVSRTFGTRSSRDVDKFEGVAHHTAKTGSPLLDDCGAAFDCVVANVYDVDDWLKIIVGRIVAAEFVRENYEPLIYRSDDY